MNDTELLKRYAQQGCEESFRELVERRLGLVLSAALRQVGGNRQLAEDVAQSVFSDLARKAAQLTECKTLSGWLYTSARFAAAKIARRERRRSDREREALIMQSEPRISEPNPEWSTLAPALDEAMHDLKDSDRNAILLRYFEQQPFAAVGDRLGTSEDGARMRVERALKRLRDKLAQRGITSTCAGLAAALASQSVSAAPSGLAMSISTVALGTAGVGAAAASAASFAGFELITSMTKLKMAGLALILAGIATPLTIQHRTNRELRAANSSLAAANQRLESKLAVLAGEASRIENLKSPPSSAPDANLSELMRLRAEMTRARQELRDAGKPPLSGDPIDPMLQQLSGRVAQLRQGLAQSPHLNIPELQYLTEKGWLDAAAASDRIETEEDFRQAFSKLRQSAKSEVGKRIQAAIRKYGEANGGQLPKELSDLSPYLEEPLDPVILSRYEWTGNTNDGRGVLFREVAPPVDEEFDTRFEFMRDGITTTAFSAVGSIIQSAAERYAQANGGILPRDPQHLTPYLERSVDEQRIRKFLAKIPPGVTTLAELHRR